MFTQGITLSLQAITLSPNSIKLTSQHILVKMKCLHGKPCAQTKRIFLVLQSKPQLLLLRGRKATYTKKPQPLENLENNHILAAKSTTNSRKCAQSKIYWFLNVPLTFSGGYGCPFDGVNIIVRE